MDVNSINIFQSIMQELKGAESNPNSKYKDHHDEEEEEEQGEDLENYSGKKRKALHFGSSALEQNDMLFEKDGPNGDLDSVQEEDEEDEEKGVQESDYFDEDDMNENANLEGDHYLQDNPQLTDSEISDSDYSDHAQENRQDDFDHQQDDMEFDPGNFYNKRSNNDAYHVDYGQFFNYNRYDSY